jgi:membrane-associated protease RseP (regulator of RpoE activity)
MIWLFWLFWMGLITYYIVRRVTSITRTSVWLLWLVAMSPAIVLTGWTIASNGGKMSPAIVILICVVSFSLYLYLVQRGRIAPPASPSSAPTSVPVSPLATSQSRPETTPSRPLDKAEESDLQNCFPWSVYYLQNIEYRPQAVICRGQLRTTPDTAYQTIQANIKTQFGDRFFVVFQEGTNSKPFFALVPNPQASAEAKRQRPTLTRPGIALLLAGLTLITSTIAGMEMTQPPSAPSWQLLPLGIPYALAIMGFLGVRELGHYWTARSYRMATTLPYFIPVIPFPLLPLGTIGAFIQLRSPIPHRKALFDIGVIGPVAGLIVALPLLIIGLTQSSVVALPPSSASLLDFKALDPKFSLVLAVLGKLTLGSSLMANQAIKLHPIAIAGWLGVLFTAFNLMPVGQLDGGRMVHAMFGQRTGAIIGQISRILLLLLSVLPHQHLLLWAILLFLLPATDEPALNDVTELDHTRDGVGLLLLAGLVLIVLPAPKMVLGWLGL